MNKRLLILALGLTGCADMNQPLTYWDKHGSTITVHHVSGKTDQTETLTAKKLKSDRVEGFAVTAGKADFKPKEPDKKSTSERQLSEKVESLTKQIASLKDEIKSSPKRAAKKEEPETNDSAQVPKKPTDETNAIAEAPNPTGPLPQAEANAENPLERLNEGITHSDGFPGSRACLKPCGDRRFSGDSAGIRLDYGNPVPIGAGSDAAAGRERDVDQSGTCRSIRVPSGERGCCDRVALQPDRPDGKTDEI
jgi:hypothetical protein